MPEPQPPAGDLALPAGRVAWWRFGPIHGRPLFVGAHGAGAPCASPFMQALGTGLDARGIGVVLFDFPYMTRSAQLRRRLPPDRPDVLVGACQAMLDLVREWMAGDIGPTRVVVGGKSMGGRMWSMRLASGDAPEVTAAVYLGYPLHPAGRPEKLRAAHLYHITVPQLFLTGSRDPLAEVDRLRDVLALLPRAHLQIIDGGDHSLATQRRAPLAGSDAWLDIAARFIHTHA